MVKLTVPSIQLKWLDMQRSKETQPMTIPAVGDGAGKGRKEKIVGFKDLSLSFLLFSF